MENSDYNILINGILNTPVLREEIENLEKRTCALNLITTNWLKNLEFSSVYLVHKDRKAKYNKGKYCGPEKKAFLQKITNRDHIFNIIVAGEFNFQKSETGVISIVANNCEPLDRIGDVMKENDEKKLHTGARFFVKTCHPLFCYFCTKHHKDEKLPFVRQNWCVLSVKNFNGNEIKCSSSSIIQPALMLMPNFMAVCNMIISNRISFGENSYKMSGSIEEMIIFQKTSLNRANFESLEYLSNYAIEFPNEPLTNHEEDEVIVEEN